MDGEDFRAPQTREKIIKTLEAAMKDRPFQLNARVPSDPRQLEDMLFQSSHTKEEYLRKINKVLQMASGQQQGPAQRQPQMNYDMNMGGGMNASQRTGPMMGAAGQHMMVDPMQQTQQLPAPPNATISTGPLPPQSQQQHHYGMDGQGRLMSQQNLYAQQQSMGGGMVQQPMGMQAQGGGMVMGMQGQMGQQPQQSHMVQQTRIMTRPTAPGMRMGQPGPGQGMIISDGGPRYGMPPQERPGEFIRLSQQQQQRFTRASMPPQHAMQTQSGHWGGPIPVSTGQQNISDTVVVTHFGPAPLAPRNHPTMSAARGDIGTVAANSMYQPSMQQPYSSPRNIPAMMAQSQQHIQQTAPSMQASRFDQPPRIPQYQRHPVPVSQASIPQPPVMGPPSAQPGPYAPMPSPIVMPGAMAPDQSPYGAASVESVGAPRYNLPAEPSPATQSQDGAVAEDPAYKAKIQELQTYLDMLKRTLDQHQKDGDRSSNQAQKLLKIIDIIEGRSKATLDLLLKCEDTLKRMGNKEPVKTKESALCQPLFDVVASLAKAPNANQTLKRVFDLQPIDYSKAKRLCAPKHPDDPAPRSIEAAFAAKMAQLQQEASPESRSDTDSESKSETPKVPVSVQREVATLEPRFRIMFDRGVVVSEAFSKADSSRVIHVVCDLEDRRLPPVPALRLQIPSDYPVSSPKYDYDLVDYCGSPLLNSMREMLMARLTKLGSNCSITSLLDTWESTVRQACLSQ